MTRKGLLILSKSGRINDLINLCEYMSKINLSTKLLTSPSFLKGASRIVDLYGKLDEYNYQENADYEALKADWENVGNYMSISVNNYGKKAQKPTK